MSSTLRLARTLPGLLFVLLAACSSDGAAPAADAGAGSDAAVLDAPATDSAAAARMVCLVGCSVTADCASLGGGECQGGVCRLSTSGIRACKADGYCIPYGSSFELDPTCKSSTDCSAGEKCIAYAGKGICHRVPTATATCASHFDMEEIDWPDVTGATVKICGRTTYRCDEGTCRAGCSADTDCKGSLPKCDTARRKCVCTATSCAGGTYAGEVCLADGRCGCKGDADCAVKQGFDQCYGDQCGCSGTAACAGMVSGASVLCVSAQ